MVFSWLATSGAIGKKNNFEVLGVESRSQDPRLCIMSLYYAPYGENLEHIERDGCKIAFCNHLKA